MHDNTEIHYLSLREAVKLLPEVNGRKPHHTTLFRWVNDGVNGLRLPHVRLGGRILVTESDLRDFCGACAAVKDSDPPANSRQTEGARR